MVSLKCKDFTFFLSFLFLHKPLRIGVQVFSELMMSSQCQIAIAFRQSKRVGKRSEQIHYRSQSVTWSGNLGLVHANRGTMPPQFKSNKRPGELVWISEHVLSFTERTAPSRTPFMKKRKGKKGGETCRPSLLNSALFYLVLQTNRLWETSQPLLPPSLPLSLALAYTVAVVLVRLDCALVRIRAAEARAINWVLAAILNRKLLVHAGFFTYSRSCIWSRRLRHNLKKKLCSSEYIWRHFSSFFFMAITNNISRITDFDKRNFT